MCMQEESLVRYYVTLPASETEKGFTFHSIRNRSFWRRAYQPISGLNTEKKLTQTHYSGLQAANTALLTATRTHMSYEITQCYLPPGRSDSLSIND